MREPTAEAEPERVFPEELIRNAIDPTVPPGHIRIKTETGWRDVQVEPDPSDECERLRAEISDLRQLPTDADRAVLEAMAQMPQTELACWRNGALLCESPYARVAEAELARREGKKSYGPSSVESPGTPPAPGAAAGATSTDAEAEPDCNCDQALDLQKQLDDMTAHAAGLQDRIEAILSRVVIVGGNQMRVRELVGECR